MPVEALQRLTRTGTNHLEAEQICTNLIRGDSCEARKWQRCASGMLINQSSTVLSLYGNISPPRAGHPKFSPSD